MSRLRVICHHSAAIAMRLGVSRAALEKALSRQRDVVAGLEAG
ncbi:MAG TPA: hypothetical protein VMA72_00735 [Streptosporangiaceae bacterium]|nr:hypothetical protein [Streptosporangiaceae bacterium]